MLISFDCDGNVTLQTRRELTAEEMARVAFQNLTAVDKLKAAVISHIKRA
jgi:hypothetical protein